MEQAHIGSHFSCTYATLNLGVSLLSGRTDLSSIDGSTYSRWNHLSTGCNIRTRHLHKILGGASSCSLSYIYLETSLKICCGNYSFFKSKETWWLRWSGWSFRGTKGIGAFCPIASKPSTCHMVVPALNSSVNTIHDQNITPSSTCQGKLLQADVKKATSNNC